MAARKRLTPVHFSAAPVKSRVLRHALRHTRVALIRPFSRLSIEKYGLVCALATKNRTRFFFLSFEDARSRETSALSKTKKVRFPPFQTSQGSLVVSSANTPGKRVARCEPFAVFSDTEPHEFWRKKTRFSRSFASGHEFLFRERSPTKTPHQGRGAAPGGDACAVSSSAAASTATPLPARSAQQSPRAEAAVGAAVVSARSPVVPAWAPAPVPLACPLARPLAWSWPALDAHDAAMLAAGRDPRRAGLDRVEDRSARPRGVSSARARARFFVLF